MTDRDLLEQMAYDVFEAIGELALESAERKDLAPLNAESWNQPDLVRLLLAAIQANVMDGLKAIRLGDKVDFKKALSDCLVLTLECAQGLELDLTETVFNRLYEGKEGDRE